MEEENKNNSHKKNKNKSTSKGNNKGREKRESLIKRSLKKYFHWLCILLMLVTKMILLLLFIIAFAFSDNILIKCGALTGIAVFIISFRYSETEQIFYALASSVAIPNCIYMAAKVVHTIFPFDPVCNLIISSWYLIPKLLSIYR